MPKRTDLKKIMIIGSGPIVIGQGCEFDYSGTQACKALKQEGYEVVLVNTNPATIMTDPTFADRTYIEPITLPYLTKIIEKEKPDALLPTLGGQTGLNAAVELAEKGVLKEYSVEMIGANYEAINKAEERELFKKAMENIGLECPKSGFAHNMDEARKVRDEIGLPCVIRPSFTLGGSGGGIAYNVDEFDSIASHGLDLSITTEILIEESIIGWKEFELEVMRDKKDNVVIVCTIENFDPMGVHTGDSITVAPAQTLTDKEYQLMRDASIAIMREIGVETGGSNVQFGVHPETGRMVVIEMNPRVSRSSALASKATGFPIAKIAAKLAVGYTLDEIMNDITEKTPACFEPSIDYCVVKFPRWNFEKFPEADKRLTTQMKSVGEAMAIGRTFKEALQKALRSLETGFTGLGWDRHDLLLKDEKIKMEKVRKMLAKPASNRIFYIRYALKMGMTAEEINNLSNIDLWFIDNIKEMVEFEETLLKYKSFDAVPDELFREAKRFGYSDAQLAVLSGNEEAEIRAFRRGKKIEPTYKVVDTCAGEFEAYTPYYYSTYEQEDETKTSDKDRIVIIGGGPNRIGQGIEFDYCCVQSSFAMREMGYESVMINSNPETVSTDYDISDLLFFEPVTREDVVNICQRIDPKGVIIQMGGQTPLNLAKALQKSALPLIGTSPESIDMAEDRKRFNAILEKLNLRQPEAGTAYDLDEALETARKIGYPVLVRPSYVLGGRAMEIVYDDDSFLEFAKIAMDVSPGHPVLIDKFLEDAIEVDVDAISDGETVVVGGVMEHIEEAGIHSGDSACALPPYTLSDSLIEKIISITKDLAKELKVIGLMNVQYAVKNDLIYMIEANPRASRTVPFVSKTIGVPLAKLAAKVMVGAKLKDLGFTKEIFPEHIAVKGPVFPFSKFRGTDIILGPEMKSTGEVMGIDEDFGLAFAKAQIAAGQPMPLEGNVFVSVKDMDKRAIIFIVKKLIDLGFNIYSTSGTAKVLKRNGIDVNLVYKIGSGRRPNVLDIITNGEIDLVINTPSGKGPRTDEALIRGKAVEQSIPCITTLSAASAAVNGIESLKRKGYRVQALQDYFVS